MLGYAIKYYHNRPDQFRWQCHFLSLSSPHIITLMPLVFIRFATTKTSRRMFKRNWLQHTKDDEQRTAEPSSSPSSTLGSFFQKTRTTWKENNSFNEFYFDQKTRRLQYCFHDITIEGQNVILRKEGIAMMMKYAENANLYNTRAWRTVRNSRINYIHI